MIDLDKDIELYKSKVAFYESQNTRGEYSVTARELKYVVEILETLRSEIKTMGDCVSRSALKDIAYINKGNFNTVEGIREWIDNAQAIKHSLLPLSGEADNAYMRGYEVGKAEGILKANTRPKGECETCGYRLFANNLIDNLVDVMDKHGITSVEEFVQKLKGGTE